MTPLGTTMLSVSVRALFGAALILIGATQPARTQEKAQGQASDTAAAELAGRHRQWLTEEVVYIISPVESEAFLLLESDAERDAFIDAFWRARDPSPGTVTNEAKVEHERRIAYANRYLGVETPRRGWQTDRGRVYIQLGEPAERQTYPDPRAFYPIELWFYRSDPVRQGLPPFFYVMFFRPLQSGEFRMYDPITDGPGSLAKDMMLQMADSREIVNRLLTGVGHEVALASVNLIPSEPTDLSRPRASARNSFLFAAIEQAPTRGLDDRYARDFIASRGNVEATVVFDPLPVQVTAMAFWDERGDQPSIPLIRDRQHLTPSHLVIHLFLQWNVAPSAESGSDPSADPEHNGSPPGNSSAGDPARHDRCRSENDRPGETRN